MQSYQDPEVKIDWHVITLALDSETGGRFMCMETNWLVLNCDIASTIGNGAPSSGRLGAEKRLR